LTNKKPWRTLCLCGQKKLPAKAQSSPGKTENIQDEQIFAKAAFNSAGFL